MPFLVGIAPLLAALGGLAGAGVGIGEAVAGSGKSATAPVSPVSPPPTPPSANNLLQQREQIAGQIPNVDAATSGAASPDYQSLIAQILSGTAGQSGANASGAAATGQQFTPANSQPTNAAVAGQPANLSDFLNSFTQ